MTRCGRPRRSSILLLLLLAAALMLPVPGSAQEPVWGGAPQGHKIAITFDDGPSPQYTPQILAVLKRFHARATFFVLGSHLEHYPWIVKEMLREGNEVGNHSFSHPRMTNADQDTRERELERTAVDLDLMGRPQAQALFRPPYSAYDNRLLHYLDHTHRRLVLWGVDSGDWRGLPADAIIQNVIPRVHPGSIVIFHDADENERADRRPTIAALERIIPTLQAAGYHLVTVSELIAPPPPQPHHGL